MNVVDVLIIGAIGIFLTLVIGLSVFVIFNKGTIDRWITGINKDRVTEQDLIYQTGSVRVYEFKRGDNICYVADKQGASTAIYGTT